MIKNRTLAPGGKSLFLSIIASGLIAVPALAAENPYTAVMQDTMVQETVNPYAGTKIGDNPIVNFEPVLLHSKDAANVKKIIDKYAASDKKRPNILLYIMDDVGWGDLGCYGGGEMLGAPTPVMDELARDGVRLTSAYSQPSSSPTRATILTGRLPVRHGVLLPPMYGQKSALAGEISIAALLQKQGYKTRAVGKWHVGENEGALPHDMGFDGFYGFLSVSDMYTEWRDTNFYPEIVLSPERTAMVKAFDFERNVLEGPYANKDNSAKNKTGDKAVYGSVYYERKGEIDLKLTKDLDSNFTTDAVKFIGTAHKENKPFFLYMGTRGAHFDNYPADSFAGKSFSKSPYRDTIMELDHHLGSIVQALKDNNEYDNTIIIVTSDNGPELESWPDSAYSPFRGAKGTSLEGGVRVPLIVHWKNEIKEGWVSDGLFDLADLFNTFAGLAGISLPQALEDIKTGANKSTYIDGIDQTSFLLVKNGQSNRKAVYMWDKNVLAAIRSAEFKKHYIAYNDRPYDVVNNGGFSGSTSTGYRLFNLHLDPKEERSFLIRKLIYDNILDTIRDTHLESMKAFAPKVPIRR